MILYYDHKRRAVFREDVGDHSIPMTLDEARKAFESGQVKDCNIAFSRLVSCDFDTDKVEQEYIAEDGGQ